MNAAADRLEFAPPPTAGLYRALILAIIAHALLLVALTWAVRWKSDASPVTAEAELWSSVPRQAAPRVVEPQRPEPTPTPTPTPTPPKVAPMSVPPKTADADIALEREKQQRIQKDKQLAAEKVEQAKRQQKIEQTERAEQAKKVAQAKQLQAQQQAEELALEKRKDEQDAKRKDALKAQEEAKRKDALKAQEDLKRQAALAAQRADNLKRMAALAGSSGAPSSTGTAPQSSGPSASYGSKVSAKVKPNIVFTEDLAGNPTAEVEVRAAPDGTIVSRKLTRSSGVRAWDEAVLKALDKTETLPRDTDGRVPSPITFFFRPKD